MRETVTSGRTETPVRFGIMCYGPVMPEWQARAVRRLLALPGVELGLVIVDADPQPGGVRERIETVFPHLVLFKLYRKLFVVPRVRRPVDMGETFVGAPRLRCRTVRKGSFSQYFLPEDVERIRAHNLDFVLRFGFNIIRGDVLRSARLGVWSFHHDDERRYRGSPPCFWEIYEGDPATGAILQRLTDRLDGGVVLKRGSFPTIEHSYVENLDSVYAASASWPAEVVRDIRCGVAQYVDAAPSETTAPIYLLPTNRQMVRFVVRLGANKLRRRWELLHGPQKQGGRAGRLETEEGRV